MALNPRQKYQIVSTGDIFNVSKECYPKITITFHNIKRTDIIDVARLDKGLEDKVIKKLVAKPKPKAILEKDLILEYRIKREHCYLLEEKENIYHELLNQKK